jgi:hypothetical protein
LKNRVVEIVEGTYIFKRPANERWYRRVLVDGLVCWIFEGGYVDWELADELEEAFRDYVGMRQE